MGLFLAVSPAGAHPHVLVEARAEIVFDEEQRIAAVRNIWQFDAAFSAFAVQGLDTDGDGVLTDAELAPLATINVESLAEFDFFTWLTAGGDEFGFTPPTEYWLEVHGGKLTLFYTLPLAEPVPVEPRVTIEIFDPDYFVAFSFFEDVPVSLVDAPAGCGASYHPPRDLDADTMAVLGSIPADEPALPPDLRQAASVLANLIRVDCP